MGMQRPDGRRHHAVPAHGGRLPGPDLLRPVQGRFCHACRTRLRPPDHLRSDVLNHLWYEPLGDGTARLGMTVVAVALAGEVLAFTPTRVGRRFDASRSSRPSRAGKWAGAIPLTLPIVPLLTVPGAPAHPQDETSWPVPTTNSAGQPAARSCRGGTLNALVVHT